MESESETRGNGKQKKREQDKTESTEWYEGEVQSVDREGDEPVHVKFDDEAELRHYGYEYVLESLMEREPSAMRPSTPTLPTKRKLPSYQSVAAATREGLGGEYEEVPLERGGFKRRRVGGKRWQYPPLRARAAADAAGGCKECGGSSMCEHGRRRSECKECGGTSMCEHGRRRRQCKECGGSSICEHDRRRSRCKECGGSSICEHDRRRSSARSAEGRRCETTAANATRARSACRGAAVRKRGLARK